MIRSINSGRKDGRDFILMANSARGVMKLDAAKLETYQHISTPIADKAGVPYETIADLQGVTQLDKVDETSAVIVIAAADKSTSLKTIALP